MIRPMNHTDLPRCGEIYVNAFPQEHWGIDWTSENAAAYLTDFYEQKQFVGFVYEDGEQILGCILAVRMRSGSKEELHIHEMAVLPEKQGQGIGRTLLNAMKDYTVSHALAGMVLYTNEHAPAAKFYEKNGFQRSPGTICLYFEA